MAAVNQATRAPRSARENASGSIRVGVTYTVAGYFLPPHLARFARVFPDIEVVLSEASREDIEAALQALEARGVRVLGEGRPTPGAHGRPVLFLHPKDFGGTLIELEEA